MKCSGKVRPTRPKKRFIIAVEVSGKINETIWCDSSVGIHIFSDHLDGNMRTHPRGCPGAFHLTDPAKAPFILCQNEDGASIARLFRSNCRFHQRWNVF